MRNSHHRRLQARLSEVVLGDERLSATEEWHTARCLSCQAETAHYRALERGFAALREETLSAPRGFVAGVMAGLDRTPLPWFRRPVAVSVSAASAVAVAATVAIAVRRRHAAA